jgi:hypothetical protein
MRLGGFMKAFKLVDKPKKVKKEKKEVRFDSGSERESRNDSDDFKESDSEKSADSKVSIDMTYKPNIIDQQATIMSNLAREMLNISAKVKKSAVVQMLDNVA